MRVSRHQAFLQIALPRFRSHLPAFARTLENYKDFPVGQLFFLRWSPVAIPPGVWLSDSAIDRTARL